MAEEAAGGRMRWWHMVHADSPVARLSIEKLVRQQNARKGRRKKKNKSAVSNKWWCCFFGDPKVLKCSGPTLCLSLKGSKGFTSVYSVGGKMPSSLTNEGAIKTFLSKKKIWRHIKTSAEKENNSHIQKRLSVRGACKRCLEISGEDGYTSADARPAIWSHWSNASPSVSC